MGVRNTLLDLNDHLFAELERLGDEGRSAEDMRAEIERARAISGVAQQVINNATTVLRVAELRAGGDAAVRVPRMLEGGDD